MKFTKNQFIWLAVLFFSCFLIYTYWETVVSICNTIFVASQPFLVGAGIAFVVNILMSFYEKWLVKLVPFAFTHKIKRPISLLLAFATIGLVFTWVVFTVLPDLIDSINTLISQDRSAINNLINWLLKNKSLQKVIQDFGGVTQVRELINTYSAQLLQQIMNGLTSFLTSLTSLPSTLINLFISIVFSCYVLAGKEKLGNQVNRLVEVYLGRFGKTFHYVVGILNNRFRNFFVYQSLEACILGTLCYIGICCDYLYLDWILSDDSSCGSLHWCDDWYHFDYDPFSDFGTFVYCLCGYIATVRGKSHLSLCCWWFYWSAGYMGYLRHHHRISLRWHPRYAGFCASSCDPLSDC